MPEEWISKLQGQLKAHIKDLSGRLSQQEQWLDDNEDDLEEKDHEEAVRKLEQIESVMECLEEALDALNADGSR